MKLNKNRILEYKEVDTMFLIGHPYKIIVKLFCHLYFFVFMSEIYKMCCSLSLHVYLSYIGTLTHTL